MFEDTSGPDSSLDKTDAEFVDIIHTCGGMLGYAKPLGHVYVFYYKIFSWFHSLSLFVSF